MSTASESLQPVVTALRRETQVLLPFTDYSRWERKHGKGSDTSASSPLRKTIKSKALEAKKPSMPRANVRLQPVAVCSHGQGIRRRLPSVSISNSSQTKVYKDHHQRKVEKSPEKQKKSGRLGKSHEPTSIRLLKVQGFCCNIFHPSDTLYLPFLQLQLAARKSSICEYSDYRDQLFANNLSIISSIQHIEEQTVTLIPRPSPSKFFCCLVEKTTDEAKI